jgi:hypothetical protein
MGFSLPVSQKLAVADSASSPGGDRLRLRPGQLALHPPPPPPGSVPLSSQTPKPNWWKPGYTDWAKSGLDSAMARIIRLDRQTLILQSLILVVGLVLLIKL